MEGPPFGWEGNSLAKTREPRTGPCYASTYRTQLWKINYFDTTKYGPQPWTRTTE